MKFQDDISNERTGTRTSLNQYTLPTFSKLGALSENQRSNGPVNAHLISWPTKAQNIQILKNIW